MLSCCSVICVFVTCWRSFGHHSCSRYDSMSLPQMDQPYLPSQDDGTGASQHNTLQQMLISSQEMGLASSQPMLFDPMLLEQSRESPPDLKLPTSQPSQQQQCLRGIALTPAEQLDGIIPPHLGFSSVPSGNIFPTYLGVNSMAWLTDPICPPFRVPHPSLLKSEHRQSRAGMVCHLACMLSKPADLLFLACSHTAQHAEAQWTRCVSSYASW